MNTRNSIRNATTVLLGVTVMVSGTETLVFDQPQCAGLSGFCAHWDKPIPVAEDGADGWTVSLPGVSLE